MNGLVAREVHDRDSSGDHLPYYGSPGSASHFPIQTQHEYCVQHRVDDSSQEVAQHGHARAAVGAYQMASAGGYYHERESPGGDTYILLRQREHLVRRAEQLQQRRQEHLRDRHQHNAAYQHHKHGVSYEIRSAFAVAPPHAEVKAARAAYSEKQRQRQAGGRKRKSDVRGCVSELTYGLDRHVSIASLPGMAERTIVVNGFSKTYAMTGWRLGYACGPAPIIRIMTKIHQSAIMSAPTTSQYAAITALKECDGEIDRMRDEYNMRRRLVVKAFNDMGLTCFEPRGAFYAFPCIKSTGMSSQDFCTKLLEQKHVAIIPGDAFGASGEGYARISYAYSVEHLKEALRRIREFLQENGIYHGI